MKKASILLVFGAKVGAYSVYESWYQGVVGVLGGSSFEVLGDVYI